MATPTLSLQMPSDTKQLQQYKFFQNINAYCSYEACCGFFPHQHECSGDRFRDKNSQCRFLHNWLHPVLLQEEEAFQVCRINLLSYI